MFTAGRGDRHGDGDDHRADAARPGASSAAPLKWVLMFAPLGAGVLHQLPHRQDERRRRADDLLGLRGAARRVAVVDLHGLHGSSRSPRCSSSPPPPSARCRSSATRPSVTCRPWGSFLFMGLIGIIIAIGGEHLPRRRSALAFAISVIGVLIFAGLTAYDTQKIKEMYYERRRLGRHGPQGDHGRADASTSTSSTCSCSCCSSSASAAKPAISGQQEGRPSGRPFLLRRGLRWEGVEQPELDQR